jgi:hypothetical protein
MDTGDRIVDVILRSKEEIASWLGEIRLDTGITQIRVIAEPFCTLLGELS